jgi:hypothetical protein
VLAVLHLAAGEGGGAVDQAEMAAGWAFHGRQYCTLPVRL